MEKAGESSVEVSISFTAIKNRHEYLQITFVKIWCCNWSHKQTLHLSAMRNDTLAAEMCSSLCHACVYKSHCISSHSAVSKPYCSCLEEQDAPHLSYQERRKKKNIHQYKSNLSKDSTAGSAARAWPWCYHATAQEGLRKHRISKTSCQRQWNLLTVSDRTRFRPSTRTLLQHDTERKRGAAEPEPHAIALLWTDEEEKEMKFLLHLLLFAGASL